MRRRVAGTVVATLAALALGTSPAVADGLEPAADPPWGHGCQVHDFGEGEAPAIGSLPDDPRCVRYAKEGITFSDGGVVGFLAAEPERVLAALDPCSYWQQDRWSVQVSPGGPALVSWSGSYWWDRAAGRVSLAFHDFRVAGVPIGADQAADLVEPLHPAWADELRRYGNGPGGGAGGGLSLPIGDPTCSSR